MNRVVKFAAEDTWKTWRVFREVLWNDGWSVKSRESTSMKRAEFYDSGDR